jgi:hypothetical protein
MAKRCVICDSKIYEENNKLGGTILNLKNEQNSNEKIHICSDCMKKPDWIEVAMIKGA